MHDAGGNGGRVGVTVNVAPTLAYLRAGALPARPTALTALAIGGVIFALVTFLVGVYSIAFHAGVWWVEPRPTKPAPPTAIPIVDVEPYRGDPAGAEGLSRAQRQFIVAHVQRRMSLPPDRTEMLNRLLADVGQRVFPDGASFEPFDERLIVQWGRGQEWASSSRAAHVVTTPKGRIEVMDSSVRFMPNDSARPVEIQCNILLDGSDPPRWSAIAIGQTLDELYAQTHGRLTAQQAAVLLEELRRAPGRRPVTWLIQPLVKMGGSFSDGMLLFADSRGRQTWLLPDGRSAPLSAAPLGVDPASGVPHVSVKPLRAQYWPGHHAAVGMLAFIGLPQALLSAYVFVGALLLLRGEVRAGTHRLVNFLLLQVPLIGLTAVALLWWSISLREYALQPGMAYRISRFAPLIVLGLLLFPLMILITLHTWRMRYHFTTIGFDPWNVLRQWYTRASTMRRARASSIALLVLMVLNLVMAVWCGSSASDAPVRALLHGVAVIISAGLGLALLRGVRLARVRSAFIIMLASLAALSALADVAPARAQAPPAPRSPWAIEDLLALARGNDEASARIAIMQLARDREAGQDALLRLLEGPVPPIGVGGVLDAIGQVWFDTDIRWEPAHRPRALRLTLEWIEFIERADDVARIAALEAMGIDPDIEPLLRPLLIAPNESVRKRAAEYLLRINPAPRGIARLLELDLAVASERMHAAYVDALVNIRPASDAALARLMLDAPKPLQDRVIATLLATDKPLSAELLTAAARQTDPRAMRLMARSRAGRAKLIDRATVQDAFAVDARAALEEMWPSAAPVFARVARARAGEDLHETRPRVIASAKRVLRALNEDESLDALADAPFADDPDQEEVRAQAKIVLAHPHYGSALGPVTFTMLHTAPLPQPQWRSAPAVEHVPPSIRPAPVWLSASLLTITTLLALVLVGRCCLRPT